MNRIILFPLLLLVALSLNASSFHLNSQQRDGSGKDEIRQKIGLDYSMPDYTTYKVDPKVMGPRLASILQELCANYKRSDYLSILSKLQSDQIEGLDYCTIEKMGLVSVSKTGNTITIRFKTTLAKNSLDLKKSDLLFTFIDGVSDRNSSIPSSQPSPATSRNNNHTV